MKKALIVMAVLIAVVASTTVGGVQTASAFNPQPEPPAMPSDVETWWDTEILSMLTAVATTLERRDTAGGAVGAVVTANLPNGSPAPGGR